MLCKSQCPNHVSSFHLCLVNGIRQAPYVERHNTQQAKEIAVLAFLSGRAGRWQLIRQLITKQKESCEGEHAMPTWLRASKHHQIHPHEWKHMNEHVEYVLISSIASSVLQRYCMGVLWEREGVCFLMKPSGWNMLDMTDEEEWMDGRLVSCSSFPRRQMLKKIFTAGLLLY